MNVKGNKTTTGYIRWDEFQRLLREVQDPKIKLVAAISCYAGLRISDVLALRWKQVSGEFIVLEEKKTGKTRKIAIHPLLKELLSENSEGNGYVIQGGIRNKPISSSYINRRLKEVFLELEIDYDGNVSSHMFRKTLGRRYLNQAEDKTKALIMLMELFRHTSLVITKRYLGITQEEINEVYLAL
jgi:integrase